MPPFVFHYWHCAVDVEITACSVFGLYSDKDMGLKMKAADSMDLQIQSDVDIDTTAQAVLGNAKSSGEITQNNGAYNADLQAGSSGFIDADSSTQIMTTAQTVVGDTEAFGTALNTAAIGSSIFSPYIQLTHENVCLWSSLPSQV